MTMKTPEEIKKALRKCLGYGYSCSECHFWNEGIMCKAALCHEAIEYMEQLETRTCLNDRKKALVEYLEGVKGSE